MSVMIMKRKLLSEQDRLTVNKGYFYKKFSVITSIGIQI